MTQPLNSLEQASARKVTDQIKTNLAKNNTEPGLTEAKTAQKNAVSQIKEAVDLGVINPGEGAVRVADITTPEEESPEVIKKLVEKIRP